MAKQKISIDGTTVRIDKNGFICLSDLAKRSNASAETNSILRWWLKNKDTLDFLEEWETQSNPDFKPTQMLWFKNEATKNVTTPSVTNYIKMTNAIGLTSSVGRYGGTYAHSDIALNFCYWISPKFQVFMIKEFQRLKADEQLRLGDPNNIKRHLVSGNYGLLMASILSNTDERLLTHPQPYKSRLPIAAESDMINVIVFGQKAKQWKSNNPDVPSNRNQRDFASVLDLTVLNNLEFLDALLIQWDIDTIKERETILQDAYDFIYPILKRSKTIQKLQTLADKNLNK